VKISHRGGVKRDHHPGGCAAFLFLGAAEAGSKNNRATPGAQTCAALLLQGGLFLVPAVFPETIPIHLEDVDVMR
jgi:hypothetical protein